MAQLPDETLSTIFRLQQRLVLLLDTATAAEYSILQQFGETEAKMPELEAIDNIKERLRIPYNRLHRILQQVAESQPAATAANVHAKAKFTGANSPIVADTSKARDSTLARLPAKGIESVCRSQTAPNSNPN